MKLAEHLAQLLCDCAENDRAIFVLDGDLADSEGADRFAKRYPERFLMGGIAEQNLLGVAAGMANTGLKPWIFSFAAFLVYRAYDQIRVSVAQSKQPVVIVGSHAGALASRNGKSHASLNDIALMSTLPCMEVFAPADKADLAWLVPRLLKLPRPAYVRLPRADIDSLVPLAGEMGPIRVLSHPLSRTIVSTGLATHWAIELVQSLEKYGEKVGHIHLSQLKPLPDLGPLLAEVETIISIEDHVVMGGLGSLLQDRYPERFVKKLGWPVNFAGASGGDDDLRRAHSLDLPGLMKALSVTNLERKYSC